MTSLFNSRSELYKTPFGAIEHERSVTFTITVPCEFNCTTPYILFNKDGEEPCLLPLELSKSTHHDYDFFSITITPKDVGIYFYHFDLYTDYRKLYRGFGGEAYITTETGDRWQLTVYEKGFKTPTNFLGSTMYQIFPDRFYEGVKDKPMPFPDRIAHTNKMGAPYFWPTEQGGYLNMDYYGGDLVGIGEKLGYLASMGVSVIYLNPVFEAHSNHRYNTANYRKIDPALGTNEDFMRLCENAKKHGISIILDGVFSHTGSDSVYFNREGRYGTGGAYHSVNSPYRSWYDFSERYPCGYRSWWGFETLPEVNENDKDYRNFICAENGVIDFWLNLGASGFRLDVADELPDDFIADIRTAVKRHGEDKLLIGEVWEDATTKWSYGERRKYLLGKGLDSTMNYPFKEAILNFCRGMSAQDFVESIECVCENYPQPALNVLMNFVSTHDTMRAITALVGENCDGKDRYWQSAQSLTAEEYEKGVKLLRLAYAMVFTLPGIPSVYYGDEIAMEGYKDPFNRGYFNWNSTETRVKESIDLLGKIRKNCDAFKSGKFVPSFTSNGVVCYERQGKNSTAAICINRNEEPATVILLGQTFTVPAMDFLVVI